MSAKDSYLTGIHQGLGYYAAWMPNQSLSLGQVGRLKAKEFEPLTSLQELKIPFTSNQGKTSFSLDHSVKINLRLIASASADIKIKELQQDNAAKIDLKQAGAFLFQAKNCREDTIANRLDLEQEILGSYMQGVWKPEWVVIDLLVTAECATILISNQEKAEIELRANKKLAQSKAFLAEQSAGFSISASNGDLTKFIAESNITPLLRISRLHKRFWIFGERELRQVKGTNTERDILEEVTPDNAE
jgi:hypothetical protein